MARMVLTLMGDVTARELKKFTQAVSMHAAPDATVYIGHDPNTDDGPTIEVIIDLSADGA